MKNSKSIFLGIILGLLLVSCSGSDSVYDLSKYGLVPDTKENSSPLVVEAIRKIQQEISEKGQTNEMITLSLPKGRYDFHEAGSFQPTYYISNHDQDNPKSVAFVFENLKNIIFDGQGSELIFHGRMLPVSLIGCENCTLKNFSIDFENPHICQSKVVENDTIAGTITYELAPWVQYEVRDSTLFVKGEGWEDSPRMGIAFEGKTKRLVYRTSDLPMGTKSVVEISPRVMKAMRWNDARLIPGTVLAMRTWGRPTPGIFMYHDTNTSLENIQIHYAEGMGLLAQVCENISMNGFSVCLRGQDDPRYFTTQADATHFSGCKGKISSVGGLYEGMMDDAINVHGTYLRVIQCIDDKTIVGQYMHPQSYGFEWGCVGDTVQFIDSRTMEIVEKQNCIASIKAIDKPDCNGAKQFQITFTQPFDPSLIKANETIGIENMTWTPEVYFAKNTIRNNRARGTLFSTPKKVVVEDNLFDHTSGAAILLCGDCNGWFETGACHDVIIRNNEFINALTNMFQFTEAIISIYPEIPDLENQKKYFHSNITIENNRFETFDQPIVYAKSVDGLAFRGNTITQNSDYPAFHRNNHRFYFLRVINDLIENNRFNNCKYDEKKDIIRQK